MKTGIASIIAAASFSFLAAQASAETMSNQEWVASQHYSGPGVGVVHAPGHTVNRDAEAWLHSDRNSPKKTFKREQRGFTVTESAVDWVASQHNSGPRIEYR